MEQQQSQQSSSIRFLYLRDVRGTDRVVTVARRLSGDRQFVEFSFSVNHPSTRNRYGHLLFKGDRFNKKLGRHIAEQRLLQGKSFMAPLEANVQPIEAVLKFMAYESETLEGFPQAVRHIALDTILFGSYDPPAASPAPSLPLNTF